MFWWEHVNTKKHVSEHNWLSGWVILSILAHLVHLAQSYFSLIFSAINTCNCSRFDLTNKKIYSDWKQKLVEKWPLLMTFFLAATAAITGSEAAILWISRNNYSLMGQVVCLIRGCSVMILHCILYIEDFFYMMDTWNKTHQIWDMGSQLPIQQRLPCMWTHIWCDISRLLRAS